MQTVRVNLQERSYDIALLTASNEGFAAFLRERHPGSRQVLVVHDSNTVQHGETIASNLADDGWRTRTVTVPAGESTKSLAEASRLYDVLYEVAADRKTVVVAVGGGVVGDLAGFVAATYNRGLPLVMVPTTLLAMVDSSVGGKTGVNHSRGKNLIGAFHQPSGVWINTALLDTLPEREYLSGLAEVVKYGVILDRDFFEFLELNATAIRNRMPTVVASAIATSCKLKAFVVERDEREETGLRAVLNYGHTFAHAFETVGGYGTWLHGEAVAAGMVCASKLAERHGLIGPEVTYRQTELLKQFSLPIMPLPTWSNDEMIAVMKRDKKSVAGRMRFILPRKLGEVALVDDVPETLVREVLQSP